MFHLVLDVFRNKKGQGLAEYGLILGLIAAVCITVLVTLGGNINTVLNTIATKV